MNIYSIRFVVNETNTVLCLKQYGHSAEEIENFWRSYYSEGRKDKYTFVDCELLETDVKCPYEES